MVRAKIQHMNNGVLGLSNEYSADSIGAYTSCLTDKRQLKLHISVSLLLPTAKTIIAVNLKYFGSSFLADLTSDGCNNFAIGVVMVCHCYQFFSLTDLRYIKHSGRSVYEWPDLAPDASKGILPHSSPML